MYSVGDLEWLQCSLIPNYVNYLIEGKGEGAQEKGSKFKFDSKLEISVSKNNQTILLNGYPIFYEAPTHRPPCNFIDLEECLHG